jgi:regulatory protein
LNNKYSPEQAFQKIKHFCAYQERCHFEVKEKLYGFGLHKSAVENILSKLIEEDYLNEERFAKLFSVGHFRTKKWGKVKIKAALKQKNISSYNINMGLLEIDETDYIKCLNDLADSKWKFYHGEQWIIRIHKTTQYLLQKGFEHQLIQNVLAILRSKENQ